MSNFVLNRFIKSGPDRYITIKTFLPVDSTYITSAFKNINSNVYFYDTGDIEIIGSPEEAEANQINKQFKCPLNTKEFVSKPTPSNKVKIVPDSKYVFSRPFGKYLLYLESPEKVLLKYNPVPRPEMTTTLNAENSQTQNDQLFDVCLHTKMQDPICNCMHRKNTSSDPRETEMCMINLLGGKTERDSIKALDPSAYDSLGNACDCINGNCPSTHPYRLALRKVNNEPCPSGQQFVICNATIYGGESVQAQGVNIAQKCSASQTTAGSTGGVTTGPTGPSGGITSNTSSTGSTTGPTGPTGSSTGVKYNLPTKTSDKPPADTPKTSFWDDYKYYIIIGGILLIVLIGIGLYFSSQKRPSYSRGYGGYGGGYTRPRSNSVSPLQLGNFPMYQQNRIRKSSRR